VEASHCWVSGFRRLVPAPWAPLCRSPPGPAAAAAGSRAVCRTQKEQSAEVLELLLSHKQKAAANQLILGWLENDWLQTAD